MTQNDTYKIGYIARTHGLKGEVTAMIEVDREWPNGGPLFVDIRGTLVPYHVERISGTLGKPFIKFEEVHNIDDASALKGCSLYAPKTNRTKLKAAEFYDDEVIGFHVEEEAAGRIGVVKEVQRHGANRLLCFLYDSKEILVPVNGPFIKSVNRSKKTVRLSLPEGFLDI